MGPSQYRCDKMKSIIEKSSVNITAGKANHTITYQPECFAKEHICDQTIL